MAAKYWRLLFTNGPDNSAYFDGYPRICLTALEMRETQGGANAATGGTPAASSYYDIAGVSHPPSHALQAFASGNYWQNGTNQGADPWWRYEFPADVEIEEISLTGRLGEGGARVPQRIVLQSSPDASVWTTKYVWTTSIWGTTGSDVRVFNSTNAGTGSLSSWQARVVSIVNYPAQELRTAAARVVSLFRQMAQLQTAQMRIISIVRGRISRPEVRAWTFDLDGHEFYVLRLGDEKTLVYDRSTDKWSWWSSEDFEFWRLSCGVNWTDYGQIARDYGSGVIVGDDTYGILWVLDPDQGYDDPASTQGRNSGERRPFPRVATAQALARGRNFVPIYEVYLVCEAGVPAFTGASVTLQYSDDGGRNYVSAGSIVAEEGNYSQEFSWRSLGQMSAQGRMFRVEDDGALRKIDGLEIANV